MAAALPQFECFPVYTDEQSAGVRWRKWVAKLENLLCALDITSDARKKALMLHYAGDEVYTIVESFTNEQKGVGHTKTVGVGQNRQVIADEYTKLKESLTAHFTPKKNIAYEILKFRAAKQSSGESLDSFHTRLRTLAAHCEFHDTDNEILTQILQGCTSNRLRRRALREAYSLEQILAAARAHELSEARASEIESNCATASANVVGLQHGGSGRGRRRQRGGSSGVRGGQAHDKCSIPSGGYVMIVTDEYSRFPEVEVLSSTAERAVLPKLDQIFARQGFPQIVKTDNGPPFNGQAFANFADQCGFKHRKITPLWPEANGAAEKVVGTLKNTIRAFVAEEKNWKSNLPTFLRIFRATPHSATGVSPFQALNGRKMNMGLPTSPKSPLPIPVQTRVAHNDKLHKQKMCDYANAKRHTAPSNLKHGDFVLVKQPKHNALTTPYNTTPLIVEGKKGSMVTARKPDGSRITRNSSHFRQLPPSFQPAVDTDFNDKDDDENLEYAPLPVVPDSDAMPTPVATPTPSVTPTPPTPVHVRRSGRVAKAPAYLDDYVIK